MTSQLLPLLRSELAAAWHTLHEQHPRDRFYAFGVSTNDVASYVAATACTEEGLEQVTGQYTDRDGQSRELHRASLRWSMGDTPLLDEALQLLPQTQEFREASPDPYSGTEQAERAVEEFFASAIEALRSLDADGLFGEGKQRTTLVVSIWLHDESHEDMLSVAAKLNPPDVVARYKEELSEGLEAFFALSEQKNGEEASR